MRRNDIKEYLFQSADKLRGDDPFLNESADLEMRRFCDYDV
ncbi:hypothetical protein [Aquicella siphonis]|nr:hypothetical protein [Aquicella siphonis]